MRQRNSRKQQQLTYGKNGYYQFKCCRRLYTINIECRKNYVAENGDGQNGQLRKKQIEISTDGKGNSRRCKNKFYILRHARNKSPVFSQGTGGIVKTTSRFWDGAG